VVTACTTGLHCIGLVGAADPVRRCRRDGGRRRRLHDLALGIGGFAAARALSTRNDDPGRPSRPWDRAATASCIGEGAGVLVLEEREHALRAARASTPNWSASA
jgi:3-oxoacyl-[acyl-carrier-protein] synthase II